MRSFLGVAVMFGVVSSVLALAQTSGGGNRGKSAAIHDVNPDLEKRILALEAKRIAAMVRKDIATLGSLLADDLSYTHSAGNTDTKASFLALIKERGNYLGVDYSSTQVIPWGNAVVVRGRAEIRLEGVPAYPVLFLDVWAQRDGTWKMVAWQATRIPLS